MTPRLMLFESVVGKSESCILDLTKVFDYLEVQ